MVRQREHGAAILDVEEFRDENLPLSCCSQDIIDYTAEQKQFCIAADLTADHFLKG